MRIHLHLGAHKTATTFVQSQLRRNLGVLQKAGFIFPAQKTFQEGFGRYFNTLIHAYPFLSVAITPMLEHRMDAFLAKEKATSTAILSDENLAGMLVINHRQGGLYRNVGNRMRLMTSVLRKHEVRYFFAIRSYKDFLPSAYLQLATNGREPDYQKYLQSFDVEKHGWTEAVAAIAEAVGRENLTVWTYEAFSRDARRIFERLAPGVNLDLEIDDSNRVVLPSMTVKGLKVMQALEGKFSRHELSKISKMMRRVKFDEPNPRLAIEDADMIARLQAVYGHDIEAIGRMGINLIA